jgi:hypothetical protein
MYTAKSSLLISNTFVLIVSYLSAPLSLKNNAIKDEIKFGSGPEYVEARPPDGCCMLQIYGVQYWWWT